MYTTRVSAFSFYLKKKTPAKEKQNRGESPCTPPRERRTAVLSLRLSISCSAHSHANVPELERMRARTSCFASRSALSKHSRPSPLERALCSLFFTNIASLHSATGGASVMLPASLNRLIEHCSEAIGSLIIRISWSLTFTLLQLE